MTTAEIAVLASAATAIVGYASTYWSNRRLAQRKDQLDRVNTQLSDLYGPLYALLQASRRAWREFRNRYRPGRSFWLEGHGPTREEAAAWRAWMTIVFMPLNRKMMDVIVAHGDLIVDEAMPHCLAEFCAHVAGYEPIIAHWSAEDFESCSAEDHLSVVLFPKEIYGYVDQTFAGLKRRQSQLLAQIEPRRARWRKKT